VLSRGHPVAVRDLLARRGAEHHLHLDRAVRRLGASRSVTQFFNKTRANLDANPFGQVRGVDPDTLEQYELDLEFLHTETQGPIFDAMQANLDAIASQTA
jgi:hypothetical protein